MREIEVKPNRPIIFASPVNGVLYEMDILEFVVYVSMEVAEAQGLNIDPDTVSELTAEVAQSLSVAGWFTAGEYVSAWAANEAKDIDAEFMQLVQDMREEPGDA
jgi:hypothetical protein